MNEVTEIVAEPHARGEPHRAYGSLSPADHEASLHVGCGLWNSHWHLLCHRSEVASGNMFVRFEILGEEVVAFHDGNEVVVFDNRCPHRGTRIFDGTDGRARWVCRYHGWSFAKGRFFVTQKDSFIDCDPATAKLAAYRTEWLGDFLFVSRAPAMPLADQLHGVSGIVEQISYSISGRSDLNAYQYRCDWKIAVENALDQYHVAVIHHSTLDKLKLEPARDEYFGVNNISYAAIGDARVKRGLTSMRRFFDMSYTPDGYVAVNLFPFTFLTTTFGNSYSLQQFYPSRDPDRTHFTSRFYPAKLSERIKPETMASFFESSVAVNRSVFVEDGEICARMPTDSWSPEDPPFPSRGEEKILHFRANMRAFMEAGMKAGMAGETA